MGICRLLTQSGQDGQLCTNFEETDKGNGLAKKERMGQAKVSMLRTWLVRTPHWNIEPSGKTTLEAKGRMRLVMGRMKAKWLASKKPPVKGRQRVVGPIALDRGSDRNQYRSEPPLPGRRLRSRDILSPNFIVPPVPIEGLVHGPFDGVEFHRQFQPNGSG